MVDAMPVSNQNAIQRLAEQCIQREVLQGYVVIIKCLQDTQTRDLIFLTSLCYLLELVMAIMMCFQRDGSCDMEYVVRQGFDNQFIELPN